MKASNFLRVTVLSVVALAAVLIFGVDTTYAQSPQVTPQAITTRDLDATPDGKIDAIDLTFLNNDTQTPNAASIPDYDGFAVAGYTFTATPPAVLDLVGGFGAETIRLYVNEQATTDGGALPQVTYSKAAGDVFFEGGVPGTDPELDNIVAATIVETDGVPPIVLSITTADVNDNGRVDRLVVVYSEVVTRVPAGLANFVVAGHVVTSYTGDPASTANVGINELVPVNTGELPDVTYTATPVNDIRDINPSSNELLNVASGFLETDGVAAFVLNAVTGDSDFDGKIDRQVVTFSEDMDGTDPIPTAGVSVPGYTVASVTETLAAEFTFQLTEGPSFDTDATPGFNYTTQTGANRILDPNGVQLRATTFAATIDGAAPIIYQAITGDEDEDGRIDFYTVFFSEPIADFVSAALYDQNFAIGGFLAFTDVNTKPTATSLRFEFTDGVQTTGYIPSFTYTRDNSDDIEDLVGIPVGTILVPVVGDPTYPTLGDFLLTDGAGPVLLEAYTFDYDIDGKIDHYQLEFSEPMDDSSINGYVNTTTVGNPTADFAVAGYANPRVDPTVNDPDASVTPDFDDDEWVWLKFDEGTATDTDALPEVTGAGATPKDLAGNNMIAIVTLDVFPGGVPEYDGARPVLLVGIGQVNSTNLFVFFSEPVSSSCFFGNLVAVTDLGYNNNNATGNANITGTAVNLSAGERWQFTTTGTLTLSDVTNDKITVVGGQIFDATQCNLARNIDLDQTGGSDAQVTIDDTERPRVVDVEFYDNDSDGWIDRMFVQLSEAIKDSSVDGYAAPPAVGSNVIAKWAVSGHSSVQYNGNVGSPNDDVLWFNIDEHTATEPTGDTDEKPDVVVTSSTVTDFKPNLLENLASGGVTEEDKAGPAIIGNGLTKTVGPNAIEVQFSEPVRTAIGDCCDLDLSTGDDFDIWTQSGQDNISWKVTRIVSLDGGHRLRFIFFQDYWADGAGGTISLDEPNDLGDLATVSNGNTQWWEGYGPSGTPGGNIALGIGEPVIDAPGGTAGPLAGTQGSVLEGAISRSDNDPFSSAYTVGSTKVVRYEIYSSASDTILNAQFAPPSTDNSPGSNAFTVRFALIPPDTLPRTYFVRAVGSTSSAGAPPIGGDDLIALSLRAKPGEKVSGLKVGSDMSFTYSYKDPDTGIEVAVSDLVVIGTGIVARDGVPPSGPSNLRVVDDPADNGLKVKATFTKASDDGVLDYFTQPGGAVVSFARVTGYNVYDESNNLVATLPAGLSTATFNAADRSSHTYRIAATDGANNSDFSNTDAATAADNTQTGDFNSDRTVDVADLVLFAANFGKSSAQPDFEPLFDMNNDDVVDVSDLVTFAGVFGQSSPGPAMSSGIEKREIKASSAVINIRTQSLSADRIRLVVEGDQLIDLKGYQFELKYDKNKVELESVEAGSIISGQGLFVDRKKETSVLAAGAAFANVVINGKGALASYVFKVKDPTEARFTLDGILMVDSKGGLGSVASVIADAKIIPTEFALSQNYPNPFNPETEIRFDLPISTNVTLVVYDLTGQVIRTLLSGSMEAGVYRVIWDGKDDSGRNVSSGMYFYRVAADKFSQVKKMLLLK